jgi:hypothetical protein
VVLPWKYEHCTHRAQSSTLCRYSIIDRARRERNMKIKAVLTVMLILIALGI